MKKKLSIIQIITNPTGGGAENIVRNLGKQLKSEGFEINIIYFNNKSKSSKSIIDIEPNEYFLNVGDRNPYSIFKIRTFLKKIIKKNRKVIVHVHLTWPFFYTSIASLFLNVNLIYTEHSTTNRRRKIPLLKYLDRIIYSHYSQIFCISDGVQRSLSKWLGRKLSKRTIVIKNGAKLYKYHIRSSLILRKPKLVSIGSLTNKKGFKNSIQTINLIRKDIENYIIVGDGAERSNLESIIKEYNLEKQVQLVGWSDNICYYLNNADIQIVPSLWEGFGLVAVEGMSTGLPIVASNVDGLREVLGENNPAIILVDDFKNPEAWSTAIKEIVVRIRKDDFNISKAARKQAEKYSFENMSKKYKQVYKKIKNN